MAGRRTILMVEDEPSITEPLAEALGRGAGGTRPGRLVPPEDPAALAAAVRAWLGDPEVRLAWRRAARERRTSLPRWSTTTSVLASVLAEAAR